MVDFNFWNDVKIYTNSFLTWERPKAEELTSFDYLKVLNRLTRYFECWGGKVILDDQKLQTLEDIKKDLDQKGIKHEEKNGVLIYKLNVAQEKAKGRWPL